MKLLNDPFFRKSIVEDKLIFGNDFRKQLNFGMKCFFFLRKRNINDRFIVNRGRNDQFMAGFNTTMTKKWHNWHLLKPARV